MSGGYSYQPIDQNDPSKQYQQYPQQYGQPQYGQPQYGQPQYGQPQYGQPQSGQPQYTSTYVYNQPPQEHQPQQYGRSADPYDPYNDDGGRGGDPGTVKDEDEVRNETITAFRDKSVRQGFIRKVYAILFVQLLVSIAIVAVFVIVEPVGHFVRKTQGLFWLAWIVTIVLMITIACCEQPRRSYPCNFILLALFTLAESYLMGVISAFYKINEVLLAMGIVAVVSLAITIFAFQTKIDFTMMGGCLFVAVIVLLCFGILTIFFHSKIVRLIYACLGALIFGLYLIFDTQIMMGGGKQYALSPEDYVFAALNLYVDIIMLYMHILQIIGLAGGD